MSNILESGTRVRITGGLTYKGKTGTVRQFNPYSMTIDGVRRTGYYTVAIDGITYTPGIWEHYIEPVKPAARFKVGDRVTLTHDAPRLYKGAHGIIKDVHGSGHGSRTDSSGYYYTVDVEGHGVDRGGLWQRYLKPRAQASPTPKATPIPPLDAERIALRKRLGKVEKLQRLAIELGYTVTKTA